MCADDKGSPDEANALADRLTRSGASLVVGHYLSACSLAASPVYAKAGLLQIAPSTTNPSFTDTAWESGWRTVFRTCGRDDKQGALAARYIASHHASSRIAILHNDSPYGQGLADIVRASLRTQGFHEAMYRCVRDASGGLDETVREMLDRQVDFVYIGGYYTDVGPFLVAARRAGFAGVVMTGGANANHRLYDIAGDASDGLLMTCRLDPRAAREARQAVAGLRARGLEPEGYTLSAVAAMAIWAEAVRFSGSLDGDVVAAAIRSHQFETSYGTIAFDERGDVVNPGYAVQCWEGGRYSVLSGA